MSYLNPEGLAEIAAVNEAQRHRLELGASQDAARLVFDGFRLGYSAISLEADLTESGEVTPAIATDVYHLLTREMDTMDPLRLHVLAGVQAYINGTADLDPAHITDRFDRPIEMIPGPGVEVIF